MSKRKFTPEEMDILRANKYTYGVIPTIISFTTEFKQEFWYRLQQGKRGYDIVRELGYDPEMLGATCIEGIKQIVKRQAKEGTFKQGNDAVINSKHPDYSMLTDHQKINALEHEVLYLRQEIEFLKKIQKFGNRKDM